MDISEISRLNRQIVRRLVSEVWNLGRYQLLPELVAEEFVGHLPIGDHYGPEGMRIEIATYRKAIPDLAVTLDDLIACGDRVVRRCTLRGTHLAPLLGRLASGRQVELNLIAIDRLVSGRLMESWVIADNLPP